MRWIVYVLVIGIISAGTISCNNKAKKEELLSTDVVENPNTAGENGEYKRAPFIKFDKTTHEFGRVIEGEIVTYGFKFENTGGSDLLITKVSTSCGCTASEYPKEPVKPGEKGVIRLTLNTSKRKGYQNKTATVLANTIPNTTTLRIKAVVTSPEKD